MKQFITYLLTVTVVCCLMSCASTGKILKSFKQQYVTDSALLHAHIGVSVFNITAQQQLLQYNSSRYFVPASNAKLPTLYAGLKYLGTQLPGLLTHEKGDTIIITPTGDPTFLHSDYTKHPVFEYLKSLNKPIAVNSNNWKTDALGNGWTWNDYLSYYSAERSPMPIYGNCIKWIQQKTIETKEGIKDTAVLLMSEPEINWPVTFATEKARNFDVYRPRTENIYTIREGREMKAEVEIPFFTNGIQSTLELLKDSLRKEISITTTIPSNPTIIYSQQADSMFKPLLYRSDNFYAEQTLLMVSQQLLGYMDEQRVMDSIIKTDFKNMPHRPRWADGSGLSRYNLFTPDDFVWLLLKMKEEFGMERLKTIFSTGNTGTLRNYYKEEAGFIYAKTGTLSGVVALSGYLYTDKKNLLVFSFLVNNHNTSSTAVRRAVERFIKELKTKY